MKIKVKTTQYSPNVVKVWYSDGSWGLRSAMGGSTAPSVSNSGYGRSEGLVVWGGDATDGGPASISSSINDNQITSSIDSENFTKKGGN